MKKVIPKLAPPSRIYTPPPYTSPPSLFLKKRSVMPLLFIHKQGQICIYVAQD